MWPRPRDPRPGDEVRFHRDRLIEDYLAAGLDRATAERRAFHELGGVSQIEEAVRDVRGRWLEDLAADLRYGLRMLRRSPGFALVAILSLALGIGANAAIFSVVNAVMLRPLPVERPDGLVQITRLLQDQNGRPGLVSYPLFEQVRDHVQSIAGAFAQSSSSQVIVIDGEDESVKADLVSGSYYTVLGVRPAVGRLLGPADDVLAPAAPAAVITDRYWQRRFGRSPAAIGRTFSLRDHTFTIVGVTPPSFEGATPGRVPDVMLPLLMTMSPVQRTAMGFRSLHLLARLKPGATVEHANAEVQVLYAAFLQTEAARASEKERPQILRQRAAAFASPDGFNPIRYDIGRPLLVLMGIVGLILLLACVNLSGLLLARAATRQRETSIRLAIGAGRGRLVRQFLTESLLLALLGGAVGFALAGPLSGRLLALFIGGGDLALKVTPDWRVLAFTAAASLLACCLAGLVPALQAVRVRFTPGLKAVPAHGHGRLGKVFVVCQLAISMILVVGAALFVGTLVKLYAVNPGFDRDRVLVVNVRSSRPYPPPETMVVVASLLERLRRLPGVRGATAVQMLPLSGGLVDRSVRVEGYTFAPDESEQVAFNVIGPRYFTTLGTPLVIGREPDERDAADSPRVAVVNQHFARRFFRDRSAIGQRVTVGGASVQIVGVVADARYEHLRADVVSTVYVPWSQRELQPASFNYLVRVESGDPMRLAPGLDRVVLSADPRLRLSTTRAYTAIVDDSIATERVMAALGGAFGTLALLVAGLGLFGVLAFQVARRTNELGVRMALGASRVAMMRLVLRDVVVMLAVGVTIGAAGALALSGVARRILFGLTPSDPMPFAIAAAVLAVAAIIAGWLPARRASRIDPLVALRHE
jgi:predicted permease